MERKGISPLIAAVLLIAFTMAVASLFAQWAPQIIQGAQQEASNTSGELQDCTGITLQVAQSDISSTPASITIQQTGGDQAVGDLKVTWFYSSGPVQNDTSINSLRESVVVEGDGSGGTVDEVTVTPVDCQGAAGITYTP